MKLHPANFSNQNIFTGYGDGYVTVNQIRHEKSLIVLPDRLISDWPVTTIAQLEIKHFDDLIHQMPEIIILGTGSTHQFPNQSILIQIMKMGIGIEVMDTQACCRTYNILVEEGRRASAALVL
ncbi:MAG: Mth938-like domain-containing protein [Nitrosomonas sp.]|nr:MAG: Mth938-like domain-containing protein [Nitrosomonas sp.]